MDDKIKTSIETWIVPELPDLKEFLSKSTKHHKIRPIFFTQIDKCIKIYPMMNFPLQEISNRFPVYFVCSGMKEDDYVTKLKVLYPKAIFLESEENSDIPKNKIFLDAISQKDDYDVVIRTCMDCVIVDADLLLDILTDKILGKSAFIGNPIFKNEEKTRIKYIRGGCNAYSKEIAKTLRLRRHDQFDIGFTMDVKKLDVEIVPYELFSLGLPIIHNVPACHPDKGPRYKFRRYLDIISEWAVYKNKKNSEHGLRILSALQKIREELT